MASLWILPIRPNVAFACVPQSILTFMTRTCCLSSGPITVDTSKWCLRIGLWCRHYHHHGQVSMWTVLDGDMFLRSRRLFRRCTGGVPVKKNREIVEDTREKQRHKHQHQHKQKHTPGMITSGITVMLPRHRTGAPIQHREKERLQQ